MIVCVAIYLEMVQIFFEGVALITFFGIVIGRAWLKVNVPQALRTGTAKFALCIPLGFSCYNENTILRFLSAQVLQFCVTKPIIAFCSHYIEEHSPESKKFTLLLRVLGTACTVMAVFTCLSSLLVLEVSASVSICLFPLFHIHHLFNFLN